MNQFCYNVQWKERGMTYSQAVWVEGCFMPDTYVDGRPVYFGDIGKGDGEVWFKDACFADTGEDLTQDQVDLLSEQFEDLIRARWAA